MKKILVTGGAGYIGSITANVLTKSSYEPIVFDNLTNGNRKSVMDFEFYQGDLRNYAEIYDVVGKVKPDAAIHFAALKAAGESMQIPEDYYENNVGGSANLFKALIKNNVRKLVFSSTAAVYGTPKSLPISENDQPQPENPYGHSKLLVEEMLGWLNKRNRLDSVRLRYFNVAGAKEDGSLGEASAVFNNVIPVLLHNTCLHGQEFNLFGDNYETLDGTCIRDYIHVVDLAEAHVAALKYLDSFTGSDFINVGTGRGYSNLELINKIKEVTKVDFPVNIQPRRLGDPASVFADNQKAKTVLNWQPKYGLREIIEHAWQWHKTHPNGYAE